MRSGLRDVLFSAGFSSAEPAGILGLDGPSLKLMELSQHRSEI